MPLDEQTKIASLKSAGYDPTRFDVDESGFVSPKAAPQPTINPKPTMPVLDTMPQLPSSSAAGAFGHSALASAAPTAVGLGGGWLGGAAMGALVPPPFDAATIPIGAIIGGLASSYGASKLQDAILPEAAKQQLATDQAQHPMASFLGGLAPSAVAFNPLAGIKSLPMMGKGIGKIIGGGAEALSLPEASAIKNAAINMGVSGGQNIYDQSQSGQPFNPLSLAANMGVGAIMNEPRDFMASLGFHNTANLTADLAAKTQAHLAAINAKNNPVNPHTDLTPNPQGESTSPSNLNINPESSFGTVKPKPENNDIIKAFQTPDIRNDEANQTRNIDAVKADEEKVQQNLAEQKKARLELDRQEAAQLATENAARALELKKSLQDNQIQKGSGLGVGLEKRPPSMEVAKPGVEIEPDYTGNQEHDNSDVASANDLEERRLEGNKDKYSSESALDEPKPHPYDKLTFTQLPKSFQNKVQELAIKRGITLEQARSVIDPKTGEAKLGSYNPDTRTAKISSDIGRGDTGPHEVSGHGFLNDLLESNSPSDRALAQRGLDIFGGDKQHAEEALSTVLGKEGHERIKGELDGQALRQFQSWWKDLKSRVKVKLGGGSDEDVIRHISQRSFTDAPYGMRGEVNFYKPRSAGYQSGYGSVKGAKLYNIQKDITDDKGNVIHGKGSTITEDALKNNKIQYQSQPIENSKYKLTKEDAQEVLHKMQVLKDTPDLHDDYGITKEQAEHILNSVPKNGGEWEVPPWAKKAVNGEMQDHAVVLRHIADDARSGGETGQSLRIHRQAARFEKMFNDSGDEQYSSKSALDNTTPSDINLHKDRQTKETNKPSDIGHSTFAPTRSVIDNIKRTQGEEGKTLANAGAKALEERQSIRADYMVPVDKELGKLSDAEKIKLENTLIAESRAKKSFRDDLPAKLHLAYDVIRESLASKQADQIKDKQPVTDYDSEGKPFQREAKTDPFYYPNVTDPSVIKELVNNPSSSKSQQYEKDFLQHQKDAGLTDAIAQKKWDSFKMSLSPSGRLNLGSSLSGGQNYFKAVRESQGVGLPDSFMRNGIDKNLNRYFTRVANDRAFYRNIESNPDIAKSLGMTKDAWGKDIKSDSKAIGGKDVESLLHNLTGEHHSEDDTNTRALNRVATTLMLGPLTNTHIAISSVANGIAKMRSIDAPATITHALSSMNEGYKHAIETGYAKKQYSKISDVLDNTNTFAERLGALADGVSNLSGRKLTDYFSKGFLQAAGEYTIKQELARVKANGDKEAIRRLTDIDPSVKDWSKDFSPEEIQTMASNWAGSVHGNHDARSLPRWMLHESSIQPFFSLASWSIAQTNHFMKNVYSPALKGNFEPLLMATLGAGLGGYVLKELREKIADNKAPIPSLKELSNSSRGLEGNIPLVAYNLMSMASFAGYGGILSTLGKTGFDVAYKNKPQGATFPLDEVMSNSAQTISHVAGALMNADSMDEYMKIGMKAVTDVAKENIQLARLAHTWAIEANPEMSPEAFLAKHTNAAKKDLRNYKLAEGQPVEAQSYSDSNPYLELPQKSFKHETDIGKAVGELPDLLHDAIKKANGNHEILKSELNKIKENNYETMPSPENMPMEFFHYLEYLRKTKGINEAQEILSDYMRRNAVNKIKSSFVPGL